MTSTAIGIRPVTSSVVQRRTPLESVSVSPSDSREKLGIVTYRSALPMSPGAQLETL
jgi:hypothetical protein